MKKKYIKPEMQDLRLPILVAGGIEPSGVCGYGVEAGPCVQGGTAKGGEDCQDGTNPTGYCSNGTAILYCTSGPAAVQYQ